MKIMCRSAVLGYRFPKALPPNSTRRYRLHQSSGWLSAVMEIVKAPSFKSLDLGVCCSV